MIFLKNEKYLAVTWLDGKMVMLSEVGQTQKDSIA